LRKEKAVTKPTMTKACQIGLARTDNILGSN
jgi:hypothetical protein